MKQYAFITLLCALSTLSAWGWGQKGHDVTAAIAERHLTPVTEAKVDSLLEGKSLVYWSNWLDNASHTPEYSYTKTWHYKNINKNERYEEAAANPAGDIVTAIKSQVEILNGTVSATHADSVLALKIIIHTLGDLHQPMHLGRATDLGGNRIKVKYFGRESNLHSVWDSSLPESAHKWSYTEWADQIDRLPDYAIKTIVSGGPDNWAKETMSHAREIYEETESSDIPAMSYDHVARWTPVIEEQFLKGGLRLAHLLNTLFDPDYGK